MTTLVAGGAASGKSEYAESLAEEAMLTAARGMYLATMTASDPESLSRIEKHRDRRADKGYETVEVPNGAALSDFAARLEESPDAGDTVLLLDDFGNLVADELFAGDRPVAVTRLLSEEERAEVVERLTAPLRLLHGTAGTLVLVSNDVFGDGPGNGDPGTENYLRILAELNRKTAGFADRVCDVAAGLPDYYKGGDRE